ncbi:hypothetical protein RJT34_21800 [Clitoria ternatea]|uniref:Uncharacterized protein n=1 Tax=Clitoria ternatea TaxID=43366 RepID=A0AAN9IUY5_CLITE
MTILSRRSLGFPQPPLPLLTSSLDKIVWLWHSNNLILERTNTDHYLGVTSIAFHPFNSIIASSSLDSFVHVFNVDFNTILATLEAPPSEVWKLCFNPTIILGFSPFFI